jgi:DNA primase
VNFAEQLKNQLDIVNVVGHYVRLKRQGAGQRHVGLCPFHSEKTPSFGVHGGLQYYKCFGCDAAGDVFTFVQQIESLTFPETLKLLAERYGIPMPERQRSDDPEAQRYAALLEMHDIAAETFQNNLRGSLGTEARGYLESRGVSRASMDEFRLGLADASGQQLVRRLEKFGAALLEESGLVAKRESGGFYDRFRGRLIFPIHNESGKVIAFGGRALRAGDEP